VRTLLGKQSLEFASWNQELHSFASRRTLVHLAANGSNEPKTTDAAQCTDVCFRRYAKNPFQNYLGFGRGFWQRKSGAFTGVSKRSVLGMRQYYGRLRSAKIILLPHKKNLKDVLISSLSIIFKRSCCPLLSIMRCARFARKATAPASLFKNL
jgi:hypothetical protein